LYISHDRMKEEFWPILAEAAKWVKSNEDVLYDTHWIGGSPINMEVYGFGSWTPHKGIITLRNPDDKPVTFNFIPDNILEIPYDFRGNFLLKSALKDAQEQTAVKIGSSDTCRLEIGPFETKILEVTPER
jgi:hypothetical protein